MGNRYDKYKDSGIAWIGEIPEHWDKNKIIRLFSIIGSGTTPKSSKEDNYIGSVNWIQSGDINGGYIENCKNTISDTALKEYPTLKIYKAPFIIVAMYGASVGNISISNINGCVNQACCVMNETKQNFKYLFYAMNSVKRYLIYKAEGGGQPNISQDKIKNTWMPIPPFEEQQSIATYLDQKCGEIDELITLQEEMITKLQSYKQSVITKAVTKGLNKNVPLKDSGIEWIGEIPKHWDVKRLKYFGNNYNGLTYNPNDICNSQEGTIVLRSSNIKDNKLCFDDNVYVNKEIPTKLFVNKGDILICSRNGSASLIGKAALIETDIKATFGAFMMIFKGNNIHHKYLYYIVTSCISQYKWLFTTATINQLTNSMLGEIFAPFICDRLEQQSIADYLDQKCSEIDALISIKQQKIEKLKDYKKSLIFECVTGKRKVS